MTNSGDAELRPGCAPSARFGGGRLIYDGGSYAQTKTAIRQILEFDTFFAPNFFDHANRGPPRFGVALFDFMDSPLGQPDAKAELGLAPAEHRPHHPDFGGESTPLKAHNLVQVARTLCPELHRHQNVTHVTEGAPGSFPPGAISSDRDYPVRDRSCGGSGTPRSTRSDPRSCELQPVGFLRNQQRWLDCRCWPSTGW